MRSTMANLWHPVKGVQIRDLGEIRREDPLKVSLIYSPMWVQLYNVPIGCVSKNLAIQLGNFIGEFMEYDGSSLGTVSTSSNDDKCIVARRMRGTGKWDQWEKTREVNGKWSGILMNNLMEHDLEDEVFIGEEGKKRNRREMEADLAKAEPNISIVRSRGTLEIIRRLRYMLKLYNPQVVFFMETKISSNQMERVRKSCGFLNGIDVSSDGSKGGLCLAWREYKKIQLKSFSRRHIDVIIDEEDEGHKWRFTGFYGSPYSQGRAEAWNLLRHLGGLVREEGRMEGFRKTLEECDLSDMGFT
ncbi:hypothetical protein Goari_024862, partial [Gossypium aridum]|nr:hypothetical protein [Gossypium aridum]